MKKIVLLCAAGMSTSMLISKIKEAASNNEFDCVVEAYSVSEAKLRGEDADVILLGPQVRYELERVKGLLPNKPVDSIEMMAYGMMDGTAVLKQAKSLMGL